MDNLKFYAKNNKEREGLLSTAKQFNGDIGMSVWNSTWINVPKEHLERVKLGAKLN